jgi:Rps23 Pro-64 3,4-dihydroxylase Tpa1-like proline 4-hydroxylase
MNIRLLDQPFPHVVIDNFYDDQELKDIKDELHFLAKPGKLMPPGRIHGAPGMTTHGALMLEEVYSNRKVSDILSIFKKKYTKEFIDSIVNKWPSFEKLRHINSRVTKVRYYHNGEGYVPHIDANRDFIALSYFHSHPKKFQGGELHCTDYNYTLDCADNTFILLPSYIKHEVIKVCIENDDYFNQNGRFCVTQFLDAIPHTIDKKIA